MNEPANPSKSARAIPLWPAALAVVVQWFATYVPSLVIPSTPIQFFGLVLGPGVGLLALYVWWWWTRHDRGTKILATVAPLLAFPPAVAVADPSARMLIYLYGVPIFSALFLAWVAWGPERPRAKAVLVGLAVVAAGLGTLVRSDGVDGDFFPDPAWRWAPSAEDRLLEQGTDDGTAVADGVQGSLADAPWPGFRGARRDGVVTVPTSISTDWSAAPPELLWRRPVGPGWSSFSVAGGALFTQEQRGEEELVSAYDAASGEPIWHFADAARFWEPLAGAGPRATPTLEGDWLYALGATGVLNALDAKTGTSRWRRDIAADTGATTPEWGFASSPLLIDGADGGRQVVVHTGAPSGKGLIAYDALSGEPRWTASAGPLSYSSVQLVELAGRPQLLLPTGDGLSGYGLDGRPLWSHAWRVPGGARVVQPAVVGDAVLLGTGFGMGMRRIDVTAKEASGFSIDERWTSRRLKPYYNDFVVYGDHVYGFDGRILACLDLETGELQWKGGRYGNGQLVLLETQGLLVVLTDRGQVTLVKASPDAFTELARIEAIDGKTWNHPVYADGVLYVRNAEQMAAFRLP
ncbi:MAG: PQQ-binding-like beta-propeller repeat protein [Acidobacteriota bacterium]